MFHGFSWTVNEQLECVGHDAGSPWGCAGRWRRWRLKLCGRQIYPMRFWVERHRSRAALGLQSLKDRQFVWCFFSRDCRRAVSARRESELRCVIEGTAVDAGANRDTAHDLSAFGIEHHHHFVVAAREQTVMRRIQSDSTWSFARRKRPARDDFMFVRVDHRNFALVFDVAVNTTCCLIHRGEFWSSSKRNRR